MFDDICYFADLFARQRKRESDFNISRRRFLCATNMLDDGKPKKSQDGPKLSPGDHKFVFLLYDHAIARYIQRMHCPGAAECAGDFDN